MSIIASDRNRDVSAGLFFSEDSVKKGVYDELAQVRARDLVLYSHWPVKTARYFELLSKGTD